MDKKQALDILNEKMTRECVCTLRAQAKQAVPGEGSASAEIFFIGEAPGAKEDEEGYPFVGAAGKFLNEMLASINLKREDIYITNVVKYRPPNNRDPNPEEISSCREWLVEQIKIIQPKVIVTLGRHALAHFLPDKKISETHGQAFRKTFPDLGTLVFFVLYHPAAALYNGSMRATLIQDFQKIPKVLEKVSNI
jgi:uracil-DNA glycosylase